MSPPKKLKPVKQKEWPTDISSARALQEKLRGLVVKQDRIGMLRYVAGADVSYSKGSDEYFAGVVLMSYPEMEVLEESWAVGSAPLPYVPGYLSFREGPVTLNAFNALSRRPDLVIFDGQGLAHPRGMGLASHLGLLLGIPSIGCAKSVLVGEFDEPSDSRGSMTPMTFKGETVGMVVRTRDGVKPVYVSVGHGVSLETACGLVLDCARGYRLPEPTRRAHLLVNRARRGELGRVPARVTDLMAVYEALYGHYGPQGWWPGETPFEVMVGAILTQNTNWQNVEKAIGNLRSAGVLSAKKIHGMPVDELAVLIRPSGYFNMKAARLKAFMDYFVGRYGGSVARMKRSGCGRLREELLSINGIGPETADSILLYALGCPVFVVDAYTRRIFARHGCFPEGSDYHDVQRYFMERLPGDVRLYNEYHALIVRLAKDRCVKKEGRCELCVLMDGQEVTSRP